MSSQSNFITEEQLEQQETAGKIQSIESLPINPNGGPPSALSNSYTSGPLPPNLNVQTPALVGTGYGPSTGAVGLLAVQGGAPQNAKTETIVRTVISGGGTNTGGEVVSFETNGIPNSNQELLNLEAGTNVTLTSDSVGGVTISSASQVISVAGVAAPGSTVNFNATVPAPIGGTTNVIFEKDSGTPVTNVSAKMPLMVGDSGSGGTSGAVPAPPSGSFAAGWYLNAGGGYSQPPGTGGAANYQTVQAPVGTSLPAEPILAFASPFTAVDHPGNTSTDIHISTFVASGSGSAAGIVPNPGGTAGSTRYLNENATFMIPPGISLFSRSVLGSPVSVTSTTVTFVDNIAVTCPAVGGPFYARVTYYYSLSGGADSVFWVSDGVQTFGASQATQNSNRSSGNMSSLSPVTYAASATPTFTVRVATTSNGTVETSTSGFVAGAGCSCYMQVELIES